MRARRTLICLWLFGALLSPSCADDPVATGKSDATTTSPSDVHSDQSVDGVESTFDGLSDADTTTAPDTSSAQDTTAPDTQEQAIEGAVTLYETRALEVAELDTGGLGATFHAPIPPATPIATVGTCTITATDPGGNPFDTGPTLDAGRVRMSLSTGVYTLDVAPTADGPRYQSSAPTTQDEFFGPGEAVSITVSGGSDVPSFAAQVMAPSEPVLSAPAWSTNSAAHSKSSPLAVSWASTGASEAVVSIIPLVTFPDPGISAGNAITCVVPDTGNFTISAEAMGYFRADDAMFGPNAALTVLVLSKQTQTSGLTTVTFSVTASQTLIGTIN